MLNRLKKNNEKGFTIIEVMIVLAIAGLIILIVFLAVPALQRSSRNTSRRTDASRLSSAANNFVTNNNGQVPVTAANATAIINDAGTLAQYSSFTGAGAASGTTPTTCTATSLTANKVTICGGAAINFTALASGSDGIVIAVNAQCDSSTGPGAVAAASGRQMALVYTLETTGATDNLACLNI